MEIDNRKLVHEYIGLLILNAKKKHKEDNPYAVIGTLQGVIGSILVDLQIYHPESYRKALRLLKECV